MKYTPFEKTIIRSAEYLDSIGVEYFLMASTLLGAVRKGRAIVGDKEVNFGILAENLTNKVKKQIKKDKKFYYEHNNNIWYSYDGTVSKNNMWEAIEGFTLLTPFYKHNNTRYAYYDNQNALIWPSYHYEKFGRKKFLDREFRTPYNRTKYFMCYYGENWKIPNRDWQWFRDAPNLVHFKNPSDLDKVRWHDYKFAFE